MEEGAEEMLYGRKTTKNQRIVTEEKDYWVKTRLSRTLSKQVIKSQGQNLLPKTPPTPKFSLL